MTIKDKSFLKFITFWKWINIIPIVGGIIIFSLSIIKRKFILAEVWLSRISFNIPVVVMVILTIIGFFLSILIVYGIIKKKKIGLYSSYIFIAFVSIVYFIYLINSRSTFEFIVHLIGIIIHLIIGYFLYKEKNYFAS